MYIIYLFQAIQEYVPILLSVLFECLQFGYKDVIWDIVKCFAQVQINDHIIYDELITPSLILFV